MIREFVHSIFALVILACIIVGAAFLTGCAETKYLVKCTVVQPENCN